MERSSKKQSINTDKTVKYLNFSDNLVDNTDFNVCFKNLHSFNNYLLGILLFARNFSQDYEHPYRTGLIILFCWHFCCVLVEGLKKRSYA